MHVDEHEFTVKFMGLNQTTNELFELYKVTVLNNDDGESHSRSEPVDRLLLNEKCGNEHKILKNH